MIDALHDYSTRSRRSPISSERPIYRLSYIDDVGRTGEQLKYTNIRVSLTQIALYKITVVQQIRVYKTNAKPLFNTNFNDKQAKKLHFNL